MTTPPDPAPMGQLVGHLKRIRQGAGLTLAEIARVCGWTDHTHASRVERGLLATTPDKIERWVDACGCDIYVIARARALDAADALPLLASLSDDDRALLLRLARVMPDLDDVARRRLRADVRHLEGEYGRLPDGAPR